MNLVLVGMPGAGKSTLGAVIAKSLNMNYIDTDAIIQQRKGKLLYQIIDSCGIDEFLSIEEKIICDLNLKNSIISTGGSVIYSEKSMNSLKRNGRIFYLYVPFEEIEKRLNNIETRGIIIKNGNSLKDVYREREPLYVKYSDKVINCSNKSVEECAKEILDNINI